MNSPTEIPPSDSQSMRDELVAYLDGELDLDTSRRVEQWLAENPAAREELRRMEQTWLLLNQLPRSETDASFTETTVEMIALGGRRKATTRQSRAGSGKLAFIWPLLAWLALAISVGMLIASLRPDRNRKLLEDLPVLEHLDAYRHAESVEYLRSLNESESFEADVAETETDD